MSSMKRLGLGLALALSVVGCGDGAGPPDGGAEERDGGGDGTRDAGPAQCRTGQHVCGGGCVDDLPNEPENGCRTGCGEACDVPTGGVATCDADGACALGCERPFVLIDGTCVCEPRTCSDLGAECGAPDDGCGSPLDCGSCSGGAVCLMGSCGCMPDDQEPNERRSTLTSSVGGGAEGWSMVYPDWSLHDADDEDWYRFDVTDGGFNGNPAITVTLDRIPTGSDYTLAIYYVCDSGGDDSTCNGMTDNSVGHGCIAGLSGTTSETLLLETECSGTIDEDGTLYVRVTSATWGGSCEPYRLSVDIE